MGSPSPDRSRSGAAPVTGVGQAGFVARHGLYTPEQAAAAEAVAGRIREHELRTVRLTVVDQHGHPRSKSLAPEVAIAAMSNGLDFSGAIYSLDSGNQVFVPPFAAGGGFGIDEFTGFPDIVLVPRMLGELGEAGYDFLAGIEIEYYIVKLTGEPVTPENAGFTPPPPGVSVFELGYQYLSEVRLDGVASTLEAIRDGLAAVGLPPRSMEDEWGPGQMEFSFSPIAGLAAADAVVLFRSAVKQICQRRGLLATFMCRPALPNFFSSGWHLHESLLARPDGGNAFASETDYLSQTGRRFVAGLIEHAMPMTVFSAPTVNGYKRFRPYSFAPDRVTWALENRGALIRAQGAPGDANSHVENRMGEPAANPYLYMAANIAAGLDGIRRELDPPPPIEADPYAADAPMLPTSLADAVAALDKDTFFRDAFGGTLIDYLLQMKRAELARHDAAVAENPPPEGQDVTDWEMREYFEFY